MILLDDVIFPLTRREFIDRYFGQTFVHVQGAPSRFESLMSWNDLNYVLETQRLQPPRLRLVCDGRPVDPGKYLWFIGPERTARLKSQSLTTLLREDGATMVIDQVEELLPSVRALATDCEDVLLNTTLVNLYAGWRTHRGFDLHFDEQDALIIQVLGRKRWQVYKPTCDCPLKREEANSAPRPTDSAWAGILGSGEVLYIPRGWWHVAEPIDEPTLHLTVTMVNTKGEDLLNWTMGRLKSHRPVRQDLPVHATMDEQGDYLRRLRQVVLESLGEDSITRYLDDRNARLVTRPWMRLPEPRVSECLNDQTLVRLLTCRRLALNNGDGQRLTIRAADSRYESDVSLRDALALLSSEKASSIDELQKRVIVSKQDELAALLSTLVKEGVLAAYAADVG